jgi:hypothetical protein
MDEKTKKEIEEIIGEMECSKGFECYESGLKNLCKAEDLGIKFLLDCQEENPQGCEFSVKMGSSYCCQCRLRIYIMKKLGK